MGSDTKKPSQGFRPKEGNMEEKEKLIEAIEKLLAEAGEKEVRLIYIAAREIARR